MDYKTIMGYGNKKKVTKEKSEGTITDVLKEQFGDLKEGPAYEYRRDIKSIDKSYKLYGKSILDFYEKLRKKGLNDEASDLLDTYKKNIVTFKKTYDNIVSKLL